MLSVRCNEVASSGWKRWAALLFARVRLVLFAVLATMACGGDGAAPTSSARSAFAGCGGTGNPLDLVPVLRCVSVSKGETFAIWSYDNLGGTAPVVPLGELNRFTPAPMGRGQPTRFGLGGSVHFSTSLWNCAGSVDSLTMQLC